MAFDKMMRKPFAPFECSVLSPSVGAVRLVTLFLLWLCIDAAWAKSFVAFGPEDFAAKSVTTKRFHVLNPAVPYKLHIDNGGANSRYVKVSSGIVTLNGIDVVKPNDFNQTVRSIEKPLALSEINNLMVELRSNPDSGITLQVIGEDNDLPTIKSSIEPQANEAGWHQNDAVISFSCDDKTSGIATCSSPVTVSGEGAAQVIQGTAVDKAGNTSSTSVTINLDLTPPAITAASEPPPNAAGWHNSDVTVHFNCSDALSGIASCSSPLTVITEGAGQILQGTGADKAGNTATTEATVNIDLTPPTLQITSLADGAVVALNTLSVSGTVDDSLSGIAAVTCNGVAATFSGSAFNCGVTLQDGANTLAVQAIDAAGNSVSSEIHVTLSAAPINITEPANLSFFNFSPIRVAGIVTSQTSAVTVNGISASLSGGSWSASVPLSEGNNTLTAVATKSDGSVNTASIQVTLDTTPPRVTVDAPIDGFKTVEANITVTGIVNDIVVGTVNSGQAHVTVNGIQAEVANRTYRAAGIPLQLGVNSIQVIGKDQVGNSATTTIKVTREEISQAFIKTVSGNNQNGAIATALEQPFVVQLLDGAAPAANVPVLFKVTENDGYLKKDGDRKLQLIAVNTDADGKAQATLTLGNRAGAGNNIVEAYAVGYQGTAVFTASGTPQVAAHINVDAGTNQFGATNSALPLPFVAVVTDAGHNRLGGVPVTFTVTQGGGTINGKAAFDTVSDSDGRALAVLTLGPDAGQDNHVVEANFPGNTGFAAAFAASAKIPGDPVQTAISGVVQDNSNNPIPGVTMRLYTTHQLINNNGVNNNQPLEVVTPVVTDANGQFKIAPAPVGFFKLMADGATATVPDKQFPTLEYDLVTVAGQDNGVGSPIYLPALDPDAKVCVDAKTGGTLTMASSPGFSLTIAPGSATFPGGSKTGCVMVTPVNPDKVPMVPGFGQQPRYVVTIQPVGTTFNPPAQITIPNMDGLAPHAKTEMYSYDHDLAAFVAIGSATVSADGSVIASDPGIGVMKAGWHCGGDPAQSNSWAFLNVKLAAEKTTTSKGQPVKLTAQGSPAQYGSYNKWELVDDPNDKNDDSSAGKIDSTPSCPSQPQCESNLTVTKPGATVSAKVWFFCAESGYNAPSNLVKVTADCKVCVGASCKDYAIDSAEAKVNGKDEDFVAFDAENNGTTVNFAGTAKGGDQDCEYEYEWDFDDGEPTDKTQNPAHVYKKPGEYTVTLTAKCKQCASGKSDTVKVTVVGVDIMQDDEVISDSDQPLVEIVGKKIKLKAQVTPSNLELSGHNWAIPGKIIADYVANSNAAAVTEVTAFDKQDMEYYWIDGGDGRKISYSGQVNDLSVSAKASFNIKRPEAQITTNTAGSVCEGQITKNTGPVCVDSATGRLELHYGTETTHGIDFIRTVSMPEGFDGEFQWVQVVDYTLRRYQTATKWQRRSAAGVLDSLYPYHDPAWDSPGDSLDDDDIKVTIDDKFTMWLMFKPAGSDSIPVSLRKVSWSWGGEATKGPDGWSLTSESHDVNPVDSDATDLPVWNGNITSSKVVDE